MSKLKAVKWISVCTAKEEIVMANAIGVNYSNFFKNTGMTDKRLNKTNSVEEKNSPAQYGENFSVNISDSGFDALSKISQNVGDAAEKNSALSADEQKLSSKAQNYLNGLREKYGNFDFVIADDMSDPQSLTAQNTKGHSVIFSTEEIERMAEDEEYADKMMGQVEKAAGIVDELAEKDLGEGVQFTSLAVSIDDEGNMKLFAGLEKMSEQQQERMEKLKEKQAEENKETEKADQAEEDSEEDNALSVKYADIEADSVEELLEKILSFDWEKVSEEK